MPGQIVASSHAKRNLPLQRQNLEGGLERVEEPVQVDLSTLQLSAAGLESADIEQALHEPCECLRLFPKRDTDLALLWIQLPVDVLLKQLQIADDDVYRCLQLVRRNGHELSFELVELSELRRHPLIAPGEAAELVGPALCHRKPVREVAVRHRPHSLFEVVHGPADRARKPDRDQCGEEKSDRE